MKQDPSTRTPPQIMEQPDSREAYIGWLRREVKKHCEPDGSYQLYWDADELLSADDIATSTQWSDLGYASPKDFLRGTLFERIAPACDEQLYSQLLDDLLGEPEEVARSWDESEDIWSDLEEAGFAGIDLDIDGILSSSSFNVNLMFATATERNRDMTCIIDSFGNDYRDPDLDSVNESALDNALSYLVKQQGYSVGDLYAALHDAQVDSPFIQSVAEEVNENPSEAMSELCALVRMDGADLLSLIEMKSSSQGAVSLDKDTVMGVFNQWSGCGGALDIQLEADAVMPIALLSEIQIEGTRDSNRWGSYTVDEVYGLLGSAWDSPCHLNRSPCIVQTEDYATVLEPLRSQRDPIPLAALEAQLRDSATCNAVESRATGEEERNL